MSDPLDDLSPVLEEIARSVAPLLDKGRVADYIPALARVSPRHFAMAVIANDGREWHTGESQVPFSIQSISKLFTLALVYAHDGEALWQRVHKEPSGTHFNSMVQLEYERGLPRNPFINAGAHVISDRLLSLEAQPLEALLGFLRRLSGNDAIAIDEEVAASEQAAGHRNRALANLLKSFGRLENDVDAVLDVYFHQCAIAASCLDLARAVRFLAHEGVDPATGRPVLDPSHTKRLNSLMLTCGTYDAAGDFVYRVGLPGKSGVGGGIVAVMPRRFSVCVWSPGLNEAGNSLAGTAALEQLTTRTAVSVF